VETFVALFRNQFDGIGAAFGRADEADCWSALFRSALGMYGSVEHATTEEEPIKPSSPYAASKVAFDMYLLSVHKFLKFR